MLDYIQELFPNVSEFSGKVIQGRKIGRTIGFPTANIMIDQKVSFTKGVYGVQICVKDQTYYGIMNIGNRPSFQKNDNELSCEVHIFNFNESIYTEEVEVTVYFFVREEKAFSSIDDLVIQIKKDIKKVKDQFARVYSPLNMVLQYG